MAKKITIQHLYTTTGTTAPNDLINGEIAISHATGSEAIFLKNDKNNKEVKFIPKTQIDELISAATTGITSDLTTHETLKGGFSGSQPVFGHTTIVSGDLKDIVEVTDGHAAASFHTHGQYLTGVTADTSQTIASLIENGVAKIGLTTGITNQINRGVTAHGWGDHSKGGYAKGSDLMKHSSNSTVHITDEERIDWNDAAKRINTFLNVETGATAALDSLHEIQEYLTGSGNSVTTLLESLNKLTDTVSGNTDNISILTTSASTITSEIENIKNAQSDFITGITGSDNINATKSGQDRQFTIFHTTAGTQKSAITATNTTTGLNFGDTFEFVKNIGYDTNGHVVSGSTQTLKLPKITVQNGLTGATGTTTDGDKEYVIGHDNIFYGWNGKSRGITLDFNESFKIPIIDYEEGNNRAALSGVDGNGHLINNAWTLTTFSLPSLPTASTSTAGVTKLIDGDLSTVTSTVSGEAAASRHYHNQYVKFTDLEEYDGTTPLVISCGTY